MRISLFAYPLLCLGLLGAYGCSEPAASANVPSETLANPAPTRDHTPSALATASIPSRVSPTPGDDVSPYLRGDPTTNVARAQAELLQHGSRFYVIVVSPDSTGLEGEIWQDLRRRNIRATTGPDEGFDTAGEPCHPNCIYVHQDHVNKIGVESWKNVIRHEQRHMVQAQNNPNMAREFRSPGAALFTTYAAFLEACADDGIFVGEEIYHASERMPRLRAAIGAGYASHLERACQGFKQDYHAVVAAYERKAGKDSFITLFPPYR